MKVAVLIVAAGALVCAAPEGRQSPLTGIWVADLGSQQGLPTDVYRVSDGTYSCESCKPARRYPTDGRLRPVAGSPGTSESVAIVDSRTISTHILQPGLVRTTRMRVSPDGRTARYVSTDRRAGIAESLRTEYVAERTASGPAGSHAVSGTWRGVRYVSVPLRLRTTILSDSGDGLVYRTGSGFSYSARYGGGFVPILGPYDGSLSVSVRRIDPYRVVETRRRGSEDVQTRTYTVARDGKRMEIATTDAATGTTFKVTARRRGKRQA
jgi:hypothetical protein